MPRLSVNVNKIATLRNTRTRGIPDVAALARVCLEAGADGITIHPRPDERHIRASDVAPVAAVVGEFLDCELNIEGNPFTGLMEHVRAARPQQVTLVPDAHDVFTSDRGWDLRADAEALRAVIDELHDLGCRVSLFVSPDPETLAPTAADRVEIYTGDFDLAKIAATAARAAELGYGLNAGHDLDLTNLPLLVRAAQVEEVSIGHALIADALLWGLPETVRRYRAAAR